MAGFDRRRRVGIDTRMRFLGRGWIQGALFDLGLFPAAIPAPEGRVWGEVYEIEGDDGSVLATLDEIEGVRPGEPDSSLYTRVETTATLANGDQHNVWTYFYNAPLGRAERIDSGDYLVYLNVNPQS